MKLNKCESNCNCGKNCECNSLECGCNCRSYTQLNKEEQLELIINEENEFEVGK